MKLFANIVSILFNPLLMITYSVILMLMFTYLAIYPFKIKMFLVGGSLLSTAIIPGLFVVLMKNNGSVSDYELTDRRERVVPYLIFMTSILGFLFLLHRMQLPVWFMSILFGSIVALICAFIINFYWKISAHGIGIGGLIGSVMGIASLHNVNIYQLFIFLIIVAGFVATSRMILEKHTPMQTYAGICLGFICTFVSALLSYIYFII
jgi:PAP2 superfamily.